MGLGVPFQIGWSQKVSQGREHFSKDLESVREGALGYLGRGFQREKTASAKALGQECTWPGESLLWPWGG